ncbi:neuronal PAS domain-containing protein 4-like [Eublepharis macularius]|uniref:Neuronal PAS domain-containing protein 4-like n=1 Tax=Eublepharis macularius TaxID=481883 RepID=A0AA97JMU4_EUBMA|nr:neuronal PAS domain-containing protein 4-like [Eublepharis macularius]
MAILCESCSRPIKIENCNSRCTSACRWESRAPKTFRSTKGASKARRDQINAELQNLRSLLPISVQEKERLSYLHTMALVCLYIREAQLFPPGSRDWMGGAPAAAVVDPELLLSLPGFILALNAYGKLAYISENVSNFLGFSVVELLAHGDSIFDLLNGAASRTMQEKLCFAQQHPGTEIEVITEMRTSRALRARYGQSCSVALRGRFISLDQQLTSSSPILTFVAFCTPVAHLPEDGDHISQKLSFHTQHTLDMKITEVSESVIYHLGYHKEELINQSWYSLLHPEDVCRAAELHRALVHGFEKRNQHAVVRVLCKDLSWAWVEVIASRDNGKAELVICTNHILSAEEALHIQSQKPSPATSPPATPGHCTRVTEQQTQPNGISIFPQEPVMPTDGTLKFNHCQILDACAEKMLPAPHQPPFPTSFPTHNSANLHPPQETGSSLFLADWRKNLSCTDRAKKLPSWSPCALCSPDSTFSPASSPSADFSPLPPPSEAFPAMDTGSDPDRWAVSVLADQIHSLAEMFSQYTKQIPQDILPSVPLWPSQPLENSQMGLRQDQGTHRALDGMEDISVDEEIITTILNNLLDNGSLNLSGSELGSAGSFDISESEFQPSLLQTPLTEATPCRSKRLFLQPLSASADSHVPDSQWDARFHIRFQPGALPEEALFS